MSRKVKRINTFVKAYDKYRVIDDENDLKKNRLTLTEYHAVADILKALSGIDDSRCETFMAGVANWFKANGFNVCIDSNNCNYVISI